jgi:uncharacterized membrane protein YdjX (TVP38/TMEM64 family)
MKKNINLTVAVISIIITLLNYMFPKLFPYIGNFLIHLNPYVWIVILILIIIGQQIFIHKKLKLRRNTTQPS